jgi:hypothetical protein
MGTALFTAIGFSVRDLIRSDVTKVAEVLHGILEGS